MKKISLKVLSLILSIATVLSVIGVAVVALESGNFTYTLSDGKAKITEVKSSVSGTLEIPSAVNGYAVTSIGAYAVSNCDSVTKIVIPSSVTTLDDNALADCDNLKTVSISTGLKSIGRAAFYGCDNLTEITVDSSNANISSSSGVLFNKAKTTLYYFPANNSATSYTVPSTVNTLAAYAFEGNNNLKTLTLPSSVDTLGKGVFCDSNIEEITLSSNIQTISERAFYNCLKLKNITLSSTVSQISSYAFLDCKNLESVKILNANTDIGTDVFDGCNNLTIECAKDSTAYEYAKANSIRYTTFSNIPVTSVKLNAATIKWPTGKAGHFKPTVLPSDATNKTLKWTSSNPAVATVSSAGLLTAVSPGTTTITCASTDGTNKKATCTVTVTGKLIESLKLNATKITWPVGKAGHFKPTVLPTDAANKTLKWTSSNPAVATVSSAGLLTAVSAGTTTITCQTTDGTNKKATCAVTVTGTATTPVTSVKLNAATIKWPTGKAGHFKPTVSPSNATNKTLKWTSSNPAVATVSSAGLLTAVSPGTTTITCASTDGTNKKATCAVTVVQGVTSVKLNAATIKWPVGKAGHFKPTVSPSNAANKTLKWTSSNPAVATVSSAGLLTAVSPGTTTITCTSTDGTNKKATCTVTVTGTAKKVTSLKLNANTITWPVGKAGHFKPTVLPSDAANKTLSWTSSNPAVATVSSAGLLRAVSKGTTTITCRTTDGSNLSATCRVTVK